MEIYNKGQQYIHIDRDNKKSPLIIDAKNVNGADIIYFLTEFIYLVTKEENLSSDQFVDTIKEAVRLKTELEKRNE